MKADIDTLSGALRSRNIPTLRWKSAAYPTETHDSTGIKSYYDALRMIFDGWDYPRDPQTKMLRGSLNDLKAHYHKLGEQLGVDLLPPEQIVNELGYQYLRANTVEAIPTFRLNTENYPRSANVWDSLGEAFEKAGKLDESLANYQKAVVRAERPAQPLRVRERREHRRGEEEEEQRPAHSDEQQRRRGVSEQDVLEHVCGEQVVLRDPVERRDQRGERNGETEPEERRAVPRGEVASPAGAQPRERVREERERDGSGDDGQHSRILPVDESSQGSGVPPHSGFSRTGTVPGR